LFGRAFAHLPEHCMLDLAQAVREQIVKETPPRKGEKPTVFKGLRRLALWGGTAAAALFIAAISGRSEGGAQRLALALQSGPPPPPAHSFDAEAETRWLSEAVHTLIADDEQTKTRLASVEQNVNDVTGSVGKQIEAADAARRADDGPTVAATAALTAVMVKPATIAPVVLAGTSATSSASADVAPPPSSRNQYGVDIGSGLTILALRTRWETLRSAHPQLFEGLQPIVSVKEIPRANRVELRLVVGPLVQPAAAAQLCAALTSFGLFCQPTIFDGQRLALR
jgi:hypothetical protein